MVKISVNCWLILTYFLAAVHGNLQQSQGNNEGAGIEGKYFTAADEDNWVMVNKCCEKFEIRIDSVCSQVNDSGMYINM